MNKITLLFLVLTNIAFINSVQAQEQTISGTVTSAKNNNPLPGVNIVVTGTRKGTTTNEEGQYKLTVSSKADSLQFSFVGYRTKKIAIKNHKVINVTMRPTVEQLGKELVVTALGESNEKRSLGYSTQSVSGDDISTTQQSNLVSALQGKVSGVQVQQSSGAVGSGTSILIRGISSLNPGSNNQPLFIVDGVPISNNTQNIDTRPSTGSNATNSAEQFSFTNRAADIDPDNIKSINILKGPGATALYGLRAANGAVVITTKEGSAGPARINYKTSVGFSQPNRYPKLQRTYREGYAGRLRFLSDGSPLRFQTYGPVRSKFDPFYQNYKNFFQTGRRLKNYISISGGSDKATYFTSFSRSDQKGIVPNSKYHVTTGMLRGSTHFGDNLSVNGSVQFSNNGGNRHHGGDKSIMSNLSYQSPTFDVNDYQVKEGVTPGFSHGIIDNPLYAVNRSRLENNVNHVIGHLGFNYNFTDWLSLDYKFGLDYYGKQDTRIYPPGLDQSSQVNGYLTKINTNHTEFNSNIILTAKHRFNDKFSGTLKVGNNINQRRTSSVLTRGEGYTLPDFNALSNTKNLFTSQQDFLRRIVGDYAKVQLNYNSAIYLTLTGRNDWSSTLPENNRSFFYPSASISYIFSKSLHLDNGAFDYGKLRFSWAKVGKDASPYQIGRYFSQANGFPFGGTNGFEISSISGSENLKPEKTTSFELGTNLEFFNSRLALDATVYRKASRNQIFRIPVSNTTGLSRLITNSGEIVNKGFDFQLKGTPVQNQSFSWTVSIHGSTNKGKVQSLPNGIDQIVFHSGRITNKIVKGGEVGDLYGYTFKRNDKGQFIIGDDGFPTVDFSNQKKVGSAFPDWTGGISSTFSYNNLSLSFLLNVRQGGDKFDLGLRNRLRNGIDARTDFRYQQVIFDGVTEDGTPNTKPVEISGLSYYRDPYINNAASLILQDASWVRLRNLSVSYQLPATTLAGAPLRKVGFSLTGYNLFVITPFKGFDPEGRQFGSGSNVYGYTGLNIPPTRSVTLSVNLSF